MLSRPLLRTILLASPLLALLPPASDELAFRPKAGSELTKELTLEAELAVQDLSLRMNGKDVGKEAAGGLGELAYLLHLESGVQDTFVQSKDGRPTELLRSFEKLRLRLERGDESQTDTQLARFEGRSVRFIWKEGPEEYERSFHESKGDEEALQGLLDDMDGRCLLPTKKVKPDDTWNVSGPALMALFLPGGMFLDGREGGPDAALAAVLAQFGKKLEDFKVTCTYKGAREEAGTQLGEVSFVFDQKLDLDLDQVLHDIALQGSQDGTLPDLDTKTILTLTGEGTLLWDVAAGHLRSLQVKAELGLLIDIKVTLEAEGEPLNVEAHVRAGGPSSWELVAH